MVNNVQKSIQERLEQTRKYIDELESMVCECKSPTSPTSPLKLTRNYSEVSLNNIEPNEYMSFLRCSALMIEDLLSIY